MGQQYKQLIKKSSAVVLEHQQASGAYPAAPYFAPYNYCWFRDGSFTAEAMSQAGEITSAEKFFDWCSEVIVGQREAIMNGSLLDTRYRYDGTQPEGEWASFQLDGYGVLLWVLKRHERRHSRSIEQYHDMIELIQEYLAKHWNEPCFDWWEERLGRHATTLACVHAGISAWNHPVSEEIKAAIQLDEERTDASLLACFLLDAVSSDEFALTLKKIEHELVSEDGGVYRYKGDSYYGGSQWPVTTALLGLCYLKLGRLDDARKKLYWCTDHMRSNGWLPEQAPEHLQYPEQFQIWFDKWGAPADPLLWSQAMVVMLVDGISKEQQE